MSWGAKEKRRHFLYCSFCPKGVFSEICVLSLCIVYWIHVQNIHTFTYQKHYFIHFCCLFLKLLKAFSVSLKRYLWLIFLASKKPLTFFTTLSPCMNTVSFAFAILTFLLIESLVLGLNFELLSLHFFMASFVTKFVIYGRLPFTPFRNIFFSFRDKVNTTDLFHHCYYHHCRYYSDYYYHHLQFLSCYW